MTENPTPALKTAPSKAGKYVQEIQSMMYTFGDVRNVLAETAELVEDALHGQLLDYVLRASLAAQKRGSKSISPDDVMFVIRHDVGKLKRLREFLNWKDVRKNVKQPEEANTSNVSAVVPFDIEGVAAEEEDEVAPTEQLSQSTAAPAKTPAKAKASGKKRAHYYWDCLAWMVAEATEGTCLDFEPIDFDEELEDLREEGRRRLRDADRITRNMSKTEYMEYTECRQASFTYKKSKKFRDWLGIPVSVTEFRLSEEVLEILGFLASETVRQFTEGALKFRDREPVVGRQDEEPSVSLFKAPVQKSPILPEHVISYLKTRS